MNEEKWKQYIDMIIREEELHIHEANGDIIDKFITYVDNIQATILDIGAGIGVDVEYLLNVGFETYGVEPYAKAREYAFNENALLLDDGDMHNLPYKNDSFDGIISIQVFEHSISPFIAICEMNRVLKIGGIVFIDTPDWQDEAMRGKHHPSLMPPELLISMFKSLGFKLVDDLSRKHRTQIVFRKIYNVENNHKISEFITLEI